MLNSIMSHFPIQSNRVNPAGSFTPYSTAPSQTSAANVSDESTSPISEKKWATQEELRTIVAQQAAQQAEALKNAPPRTKLSDTDIQELAEKYDPNSMTQEQYDAFLKELVDKGVLTRDEIGYMGYKGVSVIDVNMKRVSEQLDLNDPLVRYWMQGNLSSGSPIYGSLLGDDNGAYDVLSWAKMMDTYFNNDTKSRQGYYGAMYNVLDRMNSTCS